MVQTIVHNVESTVGAHWVMQRDQECQPVYKHNRSEAITVPISQTVSLVV